MRVNSASLWILRFTLVVGFIYHGLWNISAEGLLWWSSTDSPLPEWMRFIVGGAELAACAAILSGKWMRTAAGGLALVMAGAIIQKYSVGFSFKQGGWEAPWLYFMICLAVVCSQKK